MDPSLINDISVNLSTTTASDYPPMLPPQESDRKITLCLDLDETLIHSAFCDSTTGDVGATHTINVTVNDATITINIWERPGLHEFLNFATANFEVVIFCASVSVYVNAVMAKIDPHKRIRHCLTREHCSIVDGKYVKDLSFLGRPLDRIVLMDNSPIGYFFQPRNGIPIKSWYNDQSDGELARITSTLLMRLKDAPRIHAILDEFNSSAAVNKYVDHKKLFEFISRARPLQIRQQVG